MLTDKQKLALEMDRQGKTDAEIGQALGICRESANRLVGRARKVVERIRTACIRASDTLISELLLA